MKLRILHRTRYDYSNPVKASYNEARLQPCESDGQQCHSYSLKVMPSARISQFNDFYNNTVHFFEVPQPHDYLEIESISVVSTSDHELPEETETVPMSALAELAYEEQLFDFLQRSSYVSMEPHVRRLAFDAIEGCGNVWRSSLAVMRFIHTQFAYVPFSTSVNTHMLDVISQKSGVCQDFAHVMIGMCRTLRIPARYVSGYICSIPAGELAAAQASHAWCEVYIPGLGWRGLDPTHGRQVGEQHVKIGTGRDYADIVPLKGHFRGEAAIKLTVDVNVTPEAQ